MWRKLANIEAFNTFNLNFAVIKIIKYLALGLKTNELKYFIHLGPIIMCYDELHSVTDSVLGTSNDGKQRRHSKFDRT